ncbi:DUF6461 domain-containing protein [Spongiactinospora sp. 9N601]|uniref:DUF6461 domain-containing protein n=1 Tax=Spongiactinospora sp. 9N601 TaxID=3375149 RepID=UPI003798EE8C
MSTATPATYAWLYEEFTDDVGETWLCTTFVRDITPREALRRIDVAPGPLGDSESGVAAYAAHGGTVLIDHGWSEIVYLKADELSMGTAAATVRATTSAHDFTYTENARLITTFSPYSYKFREGDDPDRLHQDVNALGLDLKTEDIEYPATPLPRALALAARATGVHLSPAQYATGPLIGPTDHLYP